MKLDDERPYRNNISHELASNVPNSNGCSKVDTEIEWETEHDLLAKKMVEQTNSSEHNYLKAKHQNGGATGHAGIEDVSYDKDVVEIKFPDTVVSSDYGGHFVKDVCIDEGVLPDQKTSAEKVVNEKVSLNFDSSMRDTNGDLRDETKDDSTKFALESKPQTVLLPVAGATDGNREEQYSSFQEHGVKSRNTTANFTDLVDEKLSLKQLLSLEGAKDSQQMHTIISESSENLKPSPDGEAIGQVSSNDCHGVGVIASEASDLMHSGSVGEEAADGLSEVMPEEDVDAALDSRGSNQINHYNPFIAYGSLEDTWEPNYSLPTTIDAASVEPICPVEKIDSFSDLVNGVLEEFDAVDTAEDASSSSLDVLASKESNDQGEGLVNEMSADALDIAAVATSLSPENVEPSDVNSECNPKCEIDNVDDVHDFKPRDAVNGTTKSKDNKESKSSTLVQTESVVEQTVPDSAKVIGRTGNRNPFESSFSGPSITSGPLSSSGHIPYSGNISLRSDSSTTSTRSFAFPVLQTEWNSSPVKMAKADRRHFRRRRGWRHGLLCCKF